MKRERTYPFFAMRSKEDANGKSYRWQRNRVNISPQDAVGIYSAFLFRNNIGKTDANK